MNILIAIPCFGGNVSNMTFHSLLNTLRWLNDSGHNVRIETLPTESLISRARNKFVTKFLENKEFNGTHLLFIDADIGFNIENLKRIIEFDREVVTCTYPVKGFYWEQLLDRIKENNNIQVHKGHFWQRSREAGRTFDPKLHRTSAASQFHRRGWGNFQWRSKAQETKRMCSRRQN